MGGLLERKLRRSAAGVKDNVNNTDSNKKDMSEIEGSGRNYIKSKTATIDKSNAKKRILKKNN